MRKQDVVYFTALRTPASHVEVTKFALRLAAESPSIVRMLAPEGITPN